MTFGVHELDVGCRIDIGVMKIITAQRRGWLRTCDNRIHTLPALPEETAQLETLL